MRVLTFVLCGLADRIYPHGSVSSQLEPLPINLPRPKLELHPERMGLPEVPVVKTPSRTRFAHEDGDKSAIKVPARVRNPHIPDTHAFLWSCSTPLRLTLTGHSHVRQSA